MRWRLSLALILSASASLADPLTFVRAMPLTGLGGVSAIEVEPGGSPAFVLSDRGTGYRIGITRTGDGGTITNVTTTALPYPDRDTEGLAVSAAGTFISYEDPGNVSTDSGEMLPSHPDFATFPKNGALEALAATPDGILYTLPESPEPSDAPLPIYRFENGTWTITARLPRSGGFKPTGADIGPEGMLYILERAFSPLGFRSRIRRLDPEASAPVVETLLTTGLGTHDNLEGLSVWRSNSGATCLSLVSDDNFLSVLRGELVEYALTETLAGGASCD